MELNDSHLLKYLCISTGITYIFLHNNGPLYTSIIPSKLRLIKPNYELHFAITKKHVQPSPQHSLPTLLLKLAQSHRPSLTKLQLEDAEADRARRHCSRALYRAHW